MKNVRWLALGCLCALGCTGSNEVEKREIPADRPSGFSGVDAPKTKSSELTNDNALTDAPVE